MATTISKKNKTINACLTHLPVVRRKYYLFLCNSLEPNREDFDLLERSVPMDLVIAFSVDRSVDDHRLPVAAAAEVAAIANRDESQSSGLCYVREYAFRYDRDRAFRASLSAAMAALAYWPDRREDILRKNGD